MHILPRTVKLCCLDQNTPFKMGINGHTRFDLYSSCTAAQVTLKNSLQLTQWISVHWKNSISSAHTSQDCTAMLFGPKHTFQDGNQCTYQIWPVQFVYGRTGDFEVSFSIANMWLDLRKPGLVEYFIFREIPFWNIQATLARWCPTVETPDSQHN